MRIRRAASGISVRLAQRHGGRSLRGMDRGSRRDIPPGCPDRTAKRRTRFNFPCHCEAEGRGDRRECLWCNLLLHRADLQNVPGDSYVASLLGMTGGKIVRIRRGAVSDSVRPAERSMPVPYEKIPQKMLGAAASRPPHGLYRRARWTMFRAYTKSMYFVENEQRDGNHLYLSGQYANIKLVCMYFHMTKLRMEAYL